MQRFFDANCVLEANNYILKRKFEHITICSVEDVREYSHTMNGLVRFVKSKLIDHVYRFEEIEIVEIDVNSDEVDGDFDSDIIKVDEGSILEIDKFGLDEMKLIEKYKQLFFCNSKLESLVTNVVNCGKNRKKPFDSRVFEYVKLLGLDCSKDRFTNCIPDQIARVDSAKYAISFNYFCESIGTKKVVVKEDEVEYKIRYLTELNPNFVEGYSYYFLGNINRKGLFKIENSYRVETPETYHVNYWHIDNINPLEATYQKFKLKRIVKKIEK